MVIDTSAVIAIILGEPEREIFSAAILADPIRIIGEPTLVESSMVMMGRSGEEGLLRVRRLMSRLTIKSLPFTADHRERATDAFRRFGKGRHPAALNFGDCMSYAVATATGEPLLFKGDDFARTDIRRVL
jgi:ribonuclease VapC